MAGQNMSKPRLPPSKTPSKPPLKWTTLWLFNIAMENGPFIDGLPIKNGGSFHGYVK